MGSFISCRPTWIKRVIILRYYYYYYYYNYCIKVFVNLMCVCGCGTKRVKSTRYFRSLICLLLCWLILCVAMAWSLLDLSYLTAPNALSDTPLLECLAKCQQLQEGNATQFNNQAKYWKSRFCQRFRSTRLVQSPLMTWIVSGSILVFPQLTGIRVKYKIFNILY